MSKPQDPKYRKLASGNAGKNKYKDSDVKPDYFGKNKFVVNETLEPGEYNMSVWVKEGDFGWYASVSVQPGAKPESNSEQANIPF